MLVRFSAVIQRLGINPYVQVSAARASRLKPAWRKPMPVRVRVNGEPEPAWRINLMPVGDGSFYLYLHGEVRRAARSDVGDRVRVELAFDDEYRSGPLEPLPEWLETALADSKRATQSWQALAPSRQKEVVRYLARLRSGAARARNLTKLMAVLECKPLRFMGRAWRDGA